jgi:hypothetical protein
MMEEGTVVYKLGGRQTSLLGFSFGIEMIKLAECRGSQHEFPMWAVRP